MFEIGLKHCDEFFRTFYTINIDTDIWLIHDFQKKSKSGIKTPQMEVDLINERLKRLKGVLKNIDYMELVRGSGNVYLDFDLPIAWFYISFPGKYSFRKSNGVIDVDAMANELEEHLKQHFWIVA